MIAIYHYVINKLEKKLPTVKLLERVISSTTNHAYMLNGKSGGKMETENRVIQEVGWDGTRVQVLDRKKDVPFLEMEGWSEAK